jgi:peptidoglycan/xylan/chitin deacetylase (PgdA/CDA1 family)
MEKLLYLIIILLFSGNSFSVCPDGKSYDVYLTFDDGPHPVLTPRILDVLKEEEVKATFFVMGYRFKNGKTKNPKPFEILDRMKKEGHLIGSHTQYHIKHNNIKDDDEITKKSSDPNDYLGPFTKRQVFDNILKPYSNVDLQSYLTPLVRLPYGAGKIKSTNPTVQAKNDWVMNVLATSKLGHVFWNIDVEDWNVQKEKYLLESLLKQICQKKGGVVLLHDTQSNTAENLKTWIQKIKSEGHKIIPLSEGRKDAGEALAPEICKTEPSTLDSLYNEVNKILIKTGN